MEIFKPGLKTQIDFWKFSRLEATLINYLRHGGGGGGGGADFTWQPIGSPVHLLPLSLLRINRCRLQSDVSLTAYLSESRGVQGTFFVFSYFCLHHGNISGGRHRHFWFRLLAGQDEEGAVPGNCPQEQSQHGPPGVIQRNVDFQQNTIYFF